MVRTMKMNTATKDKESQLEDKKIYLLAELTVLPGSLEEIKSIFKEGSHPDTPRARLRSLIRDWTK